MTRWVVIFDDTPEMLGVRRKFGTQHLDYLRANLTKILIGGGLRTAPGEPFVGGLWVVEADGLDEVVKLVENDPYYHPQFRTFKVLTWGKALEDRAITL
jgi:uncharacterized protein YciI